MSNQDLSEFGMDDDDIFGTGGIFQNRELLEVSHVPELDRVVGRSEEIKNVGFALSPATEGASPETVVLYGKTGTGKSLVSRAVTRRAKKRADNNGVSLEYAYVDCSEYTSETKASVHLAKSLRSNLGFEDSDISIPDTGLSASDYRNKTWKMLDQNNVDSFVVILDEIDKLVDSGDDEMLRTLSRAKESGKTDANIGIIAISNKINYRDELEERVDSSMQDRELVFDPYDAGQLTDILECRKDAFHEGVLDNGVIQLTSALSAKEHGDARKAVDTLYEAGRLAEKREEDTVTESHVREAIEKAEVNRVQKLINGQPTHAKYLLRALAVLTENKSKDSFRTKEVYELYKELTSTDGLTPLSYNRASSILREQSFLEITECEHTGAGDKQGSFNQHKFLHDKDIVLEALD